MIRIPALKSQVAILKAELKKQDITLQHAAALEIVALQNGFKNWRHAVEVAQPADNAPAATVENAGEKQTLRLVFGAEDVSKYQNNGADPELLDTFQEWTFNTEAEKQAFLEGLSEGNGWSDYAVVEDGPGLSDWNGLKGENPEPLVKSLKALGFRQDPTCPTAFGRPMDKGYIQYVMFDNRRSNGVDQAGPCISMDVVDEDWEYDDEVVLGTPLFFGATFAEALAEALAVADAERERGNALLIELGR